MPAAVHVHLQLWIVGDDGTVFTDSEILHLEKSDHRLEAVGLSIGESKGERREVGGQAALAKSAMGLTSASNSGSKPDPSLPLRTAHWSRRSAPLRDHRIC